MRFQRLRQACLGRNLFLVLVLGLLACGPETAYIEICGLNYTSKHIGFSVDGAFGPDIAPNAGGGGFVCCIGLPKRWRQELKVIVRWRDDEQHPDTWKEKIVDVPRYEASDIGYFAVHFYPDDAVKVLVTTKTPKYPGYPYPRPPKE